MIKNAQCWCLIQKKVRYLHLQIENAYAQRLIFTPKEV